MGADILSPKHPMQPVVRDEHGVVRFKANAIVRFLLDDGPNDMNRIARLPFSQEDREQFAQLIGYSVDGAADLDYVGRELIAQADEATEALKRAEVRRQRANQRKAARAAAARST